MNGWMELYSYLNFNIFTLFGISMSSMQVSFTRGFIEFSSDMAFLIFSSSNVG